MGTAGLIFIIIFWILITIPCVGVAWIGYGLLDKLGKFPSKTPAIQMSIVVKLVVLEVVSFTLLLTFFKALTTE